MNNVISLNEYKKTKDIIRLRVDYVDQDLEKSEWNHICPYQVGDVYEVKKSDCEKYHHQSHPRKHHEEVPIVDVVDTDNEIEFWLSEGQLRELVHG